MSATFNTETDFKIRMINGDNNIILYSLDGRWRIKLKNIIKFYYIPRDYNYLNFQATYSKIEDLLPYIEKSKSKWLIFINDNKNAKEFQKKLREKNISSEFISRESISSDNSSR